MCEEAQQGHEYSQWQECEDEQECVQALEEPIHAKLKHIIDTCTQKHKIGQKRLVNLIK